MEPEYREELSRRAIHFDFFDWEFGFLGGSGALHIKPENFVAYFLLNFMEMGRCKSFNQFCRSLTYGTSDVTTPMPGGCTWPMPLPYPQLASVAATRKMLLADRAMLCKLYTNKIITILCWLHLRKPNVAPVTIRVGRHLNSVQMRMVDTFMFYVSHHLEQPDVNPENLGRSAVKVENMSMSLTKLHEAAQRLDTDLNPYGNTHIGTDEHNYNGKDPDTIIVGKLKGEGIQLV